MSACGHIGWVQDTKFQIGNHIRGTSTFLPKDLALHVIMTKNFFMTVVESTMFVKGLGGNYGGSLLDEDAFVAGNPS